MTPEQHKQFSEACTAFGDALEKIFGTTKNKEEERQKAREIIDKYKREGILKDKPKAPTMEQQEPAKDWEILEYKEKDGAGLIDASLLSTSHIPQYDIWKVRRLSDNTVWTVGDKCNQGVIKGFQILDDKSFMKGAAVPGEMI